MESVSLYSEARNEYLKQLSTWIIPPMVEFFRNEYSAIVAREGNKRAMAFFQEFCATVPKWNQDIIETHTSTLLENCRCDYVEELMTAVFIAHTKMLTAIRVNSKQKKLQITLPKLDHFIHRIFVECARAFWKAPFLFSEELLPIERQKNILQLESMATEALSGAIRSLLPVKSILRDYMNDDESSSGEEERAPVKKSKHDSKKKVESDSDSSSDEDDALLEDIKQLSAVESLPVGVSRIENKTVETAASVPILPSEITDDTPLASIRAEQMARAAPVFAALAAGAATDEEKVIDKNTPVTIQKLDTPPEAPITHESSHVVNTEMKSGGVVLQKDPELPTSSAAAEPANPNPPQLIIDTEPSVHFTPYDTVFDENQHEISEIRYAPKVSVEDKPPSNWGMSFDDDEDDVPKLSISNSSSALDADEIVDLDAPAGGASSTQTPVAPIQPDDIDEPLTSSGDFEEIT
jgi:hypothetical protein